MRILSIELRRSAALWLVVMIVGLGIALQYLASGRHGWWVDQAVNQRAMLGLLFPFALGAGAWQALRERRSRMEELIETTPLPRWRRVVPTSIAIGIGVAAGYLLMFGAGIPLVLPYATYFSAGALVVVAVGTLAMIAAAWLGLAVGRRWPSTMTPVLLGVGTAVALLGFNPVRENVEPPGVALFLPSFRGRGDILMEYTIPSGQSQLAQAIWLAGVAATGLLLFAATSRRGRQAAIAPAALGAVLALPLLPANLSDAFVLDRQAIEQVCSTDAPRVCVPKAHEGALADLREPAREALTLLAKLPDAPTTVAEPFRYPPVTTPDPHTVFITPLRVSAGHMRDSPDDVVWNLLAGSVGPRCAEPVLSDAERVRYALAVQVAVGWLRGHLPDDLPNGPSVEQALNTLRAMPYEEQRVRVDKMRAAESACEGGDRLDILIGPR